MVVQIVSIKFHQNFSKTTQSDEKNFFPEEEVYLQI